MFKWKDRKYVNPRKKIFKNMDTNEILNLEVQDDEDNILEESDTPLTAHCLNMAQQELVDDMSKTYIGTNIIAETVAGVGRVNKVRGFCKQETREGYNLLGLVDGTYTNNGITAIVKNGVVTLNGTATAISFNDIPLKNQISFLPNKTYRVYAFNKAESNLNDCGVRPVGIIGVFQAHFNQVNATNTYTFAEATQTSYLTIRTANEKTYTNFVIKPQITEGTEQKPYEQYGASPSLNFPAQIHSLGDDKNLFDINSHIELENAFRLYNTGTNSNNSNFYGLKIPVDPKEEYISSSDFSITGISNLCFFDKDMTYISGLPYNTSNRVFNTPEGCAYITLAIDKRFKWFKLQKGIVATPWSPYMHGTVVNKSGNRNIAKINENAWQLSKNKIINKAKNNGVELTKVQLKANKTYNIFLKTIVNPSTDTSFSPYIDNTEASGAQYGFINIKQWQTGTVVKRTITTEKDVELIYKMWGNANSETFEFQLWIEEDGSEKDYVQHEEDEQATFLKEPLRGIGDVRDELDLTNNTIIRRFGKKVFDGTETWHTGQDMGEVMRFYSSSLNLPKSVSFGMSNYFKWLKHYTDNSEHFYIGSDGYLYIFIDKETCPDTASFKVWLSEHPVEIIYPLATPIIEHIDCSDKIKQFDGQTNIYNIDGAELECTLTNNRAIAQTNENLDRVEEQISEIEENTKLENINKNIRGTIVYVVNSNANEMKIPGTYRVTGENITNYPDTRGGIVDVSGNEEFAIEQIFTMYNGKKWNRICWYGTWSSWLTMN